MTEENPLEGLIRASRLAIRYLEHPDVVAMKFVMDSSLVAESLKKYIDKTEEYINEKKSNNVLDD